MLEIVITVHDQKIVLEFERLGKYSDIPKYTYAFVGMGNCELIRHLRNVIVVRDLPDNIEQYKNLVDFTAWYAFAKNSLIQSKFVALLQYDTAISPKFYEQTLAYLTKEPAKMLGYQKWPILDANFIENNVGAAPLADALRVAYDADLYQLVERHVEAKGDIGWPSSNNLAMSSKLLSEFVDWFSPMIQLLGPNLYSGHSFERSMKIFCILNNVENLYAPQLAHHYQLNSHGTQGLSVDFEKEIKRVASNELPSLSTLRGLKARLAKFIRTRLH